ncbi:MAG: WxcM-like domain-containing protein [Cyanobacteria bacterium]|nr:WxcM-like domain-containing protein [Cyanobacteriota bacterium]
MIHSSSQVEAKRIGSGTTIWQFVVILEGAEIGSDCNICSHCFIENNVRIGNRVTVKSGVQMWDGIVIDDDVFVGPNVTFTNDLWPRSKQHLSSYPTTHLKRGASIGAGSVILPGISIGSGAMVGAGSVVTKDVPPQAMVYGNPARIIGYAKSDAPVRSQHFPADSGSSLNQMPETLKSSVQGVYLLKLSSFADLRGSLCVADVAKDLPFTPQRFFIVHDVPSKYVRGEHAHHVCEQFLVCAAGSCSVVVDDGCEREEFRLDVPNLGLYLPPLVWGIQYKFSPSASLLVFASHPYDPDDYIRDYNKFLLLSGSTSS